VRAARPVIRHPRPASRRPPGGGRLGARRFRSPAYTEGITTILILRIDTTAASFIAAGEPKPVLEYGSTDRPKYSAEGIPLFEVWLMATFSGTSDVIRVKTPSQLQGITAGTAVRPVDLLAIPYELADRSGTALRATRIEPVTPTTATAPAPARGSDRDKS
jgi:hypothetical protein